MALDFIPTNGCVDPLNHVVSASMQSGASAPEARGGEAERLRLARANPRFARLPGGQNKRCIRVRKVRDSSKANKSTQPTGWDKWDEFQSVIIIYLKLLTGFD